MFWNTLLFFRIFAHELCATPKEGKYAERKRLKSPDCGEDIGVERFANAAERRKVCRQKRSSKRSATRINRLASNLQPLERKRPKSLPEAGI